MPFWFSGYTQSVPVDILWEEMGEEEKMGSNEHGSWKII